MSGTRLGRAGRRSALLAALALAAGAQALGAGAGTARIEGGEARAWEPDVAAARDYARGRAGEVAFAVFDMVGRRHAHHGGGTARMASTFKVMLMAAYLRQRGVKDRELNDYDKSLIKPMIRRSDNETATRIRDMLGQRPIERLARRAEMRHFEWHSIWGYCRTSARDQAYFMRTLHRYVPERHWDFAKRQLARIVPSQRWGIGQVAPDGWKLHFKGGWGSGTGLVDHQIALLRRDGREIGVAILTEDQPSHSYGKQTLEGVARRLLRDVPR